ncbi:Integrase [Collimonas sp. OK307]|uniref:tyrosine-type recombinase/integrase n=1 Tax=Collimonas sp. OK307 TaxID=1801620 RepID=UPI0008F2479D|nr:site-specific integrase [Collimonas sp. OK307]SFI31760.1 Integrase [Collimonas sp. OK307]
MRTINRLSAQAVARNVKPGLYSDGGGLYLQITRAGVKSWLFRYMRNGKARGMGIGPLHTVTLAEARIKALNCRRQLLDDIDPLDEKQTRQVTQKIVAAKTKSFSECAEAYIEAHRAGWKNVKHGAQWESTLETYAGPVFGDLPISAVDTALVMKALEPIWTTKNETATRVRGRIESVLDWATVSGYRSGENPARWKGHLDHLLAKPSKIKKVVHHPALPYAEVPSFITLLRDQGGTAPLALELLILTATRTNEVLNASWDEIDMENRIWIIPAARMKAEKEHRVPLSKPAMEILKTQQEGAEGDYIFPGQRDGRPMSNMVFLQFLKRIERTDITVHGFRSTFRDWVGETTNYPREVAEAALAHTVKNKVEAAYARGDLFIKRAKMMQDWASYLSGIAPKN